MRKLCVRDSSNMKPGEVEDNTMIGPRTIGFMVERDFYSLSYDENLRWLKKRVFNLLNTAEGSQATLQAAICTKKEHRTFLAKL